MKRINLLPADYKEHTRFIRTIKIQAGLFIAALILFIMSILLPASILQERRELLSQLEQQADDTRFVQAEMVAESIFVLENEIQATDIILQELRGVQSADIAVYEDITGLLPYEAAVKSFQLTSSLCNVSGQTKSRADAAGFIGLIERLDYVKEVRIRSIGLEKENDPVDFSIEIYLHAKEDIDEGNTGY